MKWATVGQHRDQDARVWLLVPGPDLVVADAVAQAEVIRPPLPI